MFNKLASKIADQVIIKLAILNEQAQAQAQAQAQFQKTAGSLGIPAGGAAATIWDRIGDLAGRGLTGLNVPAVRDNLVPLVNKATDFMNANGGKVIGGTLGAVGTAGGIAGAAKLIQKAKAKKALQALQASQAMEAAKKSQMLKNLGYGGLGLAGLGGAAAAINAYGGNE